MNEKIKVSEVMLTGLDGEDLGVMRTAEALSMARKLKADLVCESLMSFPPQCKLVPAGTAKREQSRKPRAGKVKEIRLTPHIEDHDYETKQQQAKRILKSGDAVKFVVRLQGGKEGDRAKNLLEKMLGDVSAWGRKKTNVQLNNKQAMVQVDPISSAE